MHSAKAHKLAICPPLAVKYFFISVLIILSGLAIFDRYLAYLESQGKLASWGWHQENNKLTVFMQQRNLADNKLPLWHSANYSVEEKKNKPKRILVLGDSFVWGDGYANMNDIWWRQLARELKRRGYEQVEVIASGICGASTAGELDFARDLVPKYSPDIIIMGYVTNDPDACWLADWWRSKLQDPKVANDKNFVHRAQRAFRQEKRSEVSAIHSPNEPILDGVKNILAKMYPYLGDELWSLRSQRIVNSIDGINKAYSYMNWELKILEGGSFDSYKETVSDLKEFADQSKIPVFVMTLPNSPNLENYAKRYPPIEKVYSERKIPFYNIINDFDSYGKIKHTNNDKTDSPYRYWINPANPHPGILSTHFYAIKAADILEKEYTYCLGQKSKKIIVRGDQIKFNDWVPASINLKENSPLNFTLTYPHSSQELLNMPIDKGYIQLNFENPVAIKQISLSGKCLQRASIYVTAENAQAHYDDGTVFPLGTEEGHNLVFKLPVEKFVQGVNTIKISAKFFGANQDLSLSLTPQEGKLNEQN